ncbi:unnamed protein product, partial [Mesorhabditis belari]|uniref:Uncharacterized protein n=1 Tax=Mesorhabditis belari TaxID=2138241 RepID=A0AAF3EUJ8_9BILA
MRTFIKQRERQDDGKEKRGGDGEQRRGGGNRRRGDGQRRGGKERRGGDRGREKQDDPLDYHGAQLNGYRWYTPKNEQTFTKKPDVIRKMPFVRLVEIPSSSMRQVRRMVELTYRMQKYLDDVSKIEAKQLPLRGLHKTLDKWHIARAYDWEPFPVFHVIEAYVMVLTKLITLSFYSFAGLHGYCVPSLSRRFIGEPAKSYLWRDHEIALQYGKAMDTMLKRLKMDDEPKAQKKDDEPKAQKKDDETKEQKKDDEPKEQKKDDETKEQKKDNSRKKFNDPKALVMEDVKSLLEEFSKMVKWIEKKTQLIKKGDDAKLEEEEDCFSMLTTWNEYTLFKPKLSDQQLEKLFNKACSELSDFASLGTFIDDNLEHFANMAHFQQLLPLMVNTLATFEFGAKSVAICRKIFFALFPKLNDGDFLALVEQAKQFNPRQETLARLIPHGGGAKYMIECKDNKDNQVAALHFNLMLVPWETVLENCIRGVYNSITETASIQVFIRLLPCVREFLLAEEEGKQPSRLVSMLKRLNPETDRAVERMEAVLVALVDAEIMDYEYFVFGFLFPASSSGPLAYRKLALDVIFLMVSSKGVRFNFAGDEKSGGSIPWSKCVTTTLDLYAAPNPAAATAGQRYPFLKKLLHQLDVRGALGAKVEDVIAIVKYLREKNATKAWVYILGKDLMKETIGKHAEDQLPWKELKEEEFDEIFTLVGAWPDNTGMTLLKQIMEVQSHLDHSAQLLAHLKAWIDENRGKFKPGDARIFHLDVYMKEETFVPVQPKPEASPQKILEIAQVDVKEEETEEMPTNNPSAEVDDGNKTEQQIATKPTNSAEEMTTGEDGNVEETDGEKESGHVEEYEEDELIEAPRGGGYHYESGFSFGSPPNSASTSNRAPSITLTNEPPTKIDSTLNFSQDKPSSAAGNAKEPPAGGRNDNYGCVLAPVLSDSDIAWEMAPSRNFSRRVEKSSQNGRKSKSQSSKRSHHANKPNNKKKEGK